MHIDRAQPRQYQGQRWGPTIPNTHISTNAYHRSAHADLLCETFTLSKASKHTN